MPRPSKIHAPLRLGLDAGLVVGDLDTNLLRAGDDVDALAGGNGVGDLGGEGSVVHEEEVDVVNCVLLVAVLVAGALRGRTVADNEGLVAGGHQVAGLLVGSVTDLSQMSASSPNTNRFHHDVVRSGIEVQSCVVRCR
jgi:hypothetical protein